MVATQRCKTTNRIHCFKAGIHKRTQAIMWKSCPWSYLCHKNFLWIIYCNGLSTADSIFFLIQLNLTISLVYKQVYPDEANSVYTCLELLYFLYMACEDFFYIFSYFLNRKTCQFCILLFLSCFQMPDFSNLWSVYFKLHLFIKRFSCILATRSALQNKNRFNT